MPKPRILIGTAHNRIFSPEYVRSLSDTYINLVNKYDIFLSLAESAQIHLNRNIIFRNAYEGKADWLLYIDTDMVWLPIDITTLVEFDKELCVGLCTTRKIPIRFCVYENNGHGEARPFKQIPDIPFRCFAAGTGFMLIKGSLVKRMWDNRFKDGYPFDPIPHGLSRSKTNVDSAYMGTDISFCQRVRKLGIDIWCHPDVKIGHVGATIAGVEDE